MKPQDLFAELKRRNVYKVAVAYGIVGWLTIQIAASIFPILEIPRWGAKLVIAMVLLGFPTALILAWAFELTPEGFKRTEEVAPHESIRHQTGRKLIGIIAVLAVIAGGYLSFQWLKPKPAKNSSSGSVSAPIPPPSAVPIPDKSIAVLPFESLSEDKSNAYFAEGIQDEILTRLSKVSDLKVI